MNITDIRYNAAQKAFEAFVLVDAPDGQLRIPARVEGDIATNPAKVTAALLSRGLRMASRKSHF